MKKRNLATYYPLLGTPLEIRQRSPALKRFFSVVVAVCAAPTHCQRLPSFYVQAGQSFAPSTWECRRSLFGFGMQFEWNILTQINPQVCIWWLSDNFGGEMKKHTRYSPFEFIDYNQIPIYLLTLRVRAQVMCTSPMSKSLVSGHWTG